MINIDDWMKPLSLFLYYTIDSTLENLNEDFSPEVSVGRRERKILQQTQTTRLHVQAVHLTNSH